MFKFLMNQLCFHFAIWWLMFVCFVRFYKCEISKFVLFVIITAVRGRNTIYRQLESVKFHYVQRKRSDEKAILGGRILLLFFFHSVIAHTRITRPNKAFGNLSCECWVCLCSTVNYVHSPRNTLEPIARSICIKWGIPWRTFALCVLASSVLA